MSEVNSAPDPYAAVLADLVRRRDELNTAIKTIEAVRGIASVGIVLQATQVEESNDSNEHGRYLGMSISEAAKKLLKSRRKSMNSAEIAQALIAGGMAFNTSDPGNTVSSVLTRRFNNNGDIVRVARGQWGLREWHPHANFKKKSDVGKEASGAKADEVDLRDMPLEDVDQAETIGS